MPLLFCKVPCQNLQQVVAAWSLLQPRAFAVEDGFAVARGTREASVLLDLDGCVAKVIFVLAPLQHIQPDLGTVHRWADVLGLLDSPRRVSVSALHRGIGIGAVVTLLRMVSAMLSLYLAAQYFLRYGPPVELPDALGQLLVFDINSTQSQIEDEDFTDSIPWWPWLHGIIYSIPYFVLAALLSYDTCRCRNASTRKKPTQEVYDRYFGLRGTHYTWKVAILQCFTVCLQTLGKLLGALVRSNAVACISVFFSPKTFENPKFYNFSFLELYNIYFLHVIYFQPAEAEVVEQHHLRGYELAVQKARRAENRLLVLSSAPRNQCLVPERLDIASRLAIGQIGCCVDGCSLGFGLHFDLHSHCAGLTSSSFLSKHSVWKLW